MIITADMVPCLNPQACGVSSHKLGSQAYKDCVSRNKNGSIPTSGHKLATAPPPLPNKEKPTSLNDEVTERFEEGEATEDDVKLLLDLASEEISKLGSIKLIYIDYQDELTDEQMNSYLKGDVDSVEESLEEFVSESRYLAGREMVEQILDDLNLDPSYIDDELLDELRYMVEEADTSNPVKDLARNSRTRLMRRTLLDGSELEGYDDTEHGLAGYSPYTSYAEREVDNSISVTEARVNALEKALIEKGFIEGPLSEEDRKELDLMFAQGPEWLGDEVTIDAMWSGDVDDVALPPDYTGESTREVRSENGITLVAIGRANGTGWTGEISAPFTMKLDREHPAELDSKSWGYGWDDIAGVGQGAYGNFSFEDTEKDTEVNGVARSF